MFLKYSLVTWVLIGISGCASISNTFVSMIPSTPYESERVSKEYDQQVKSLQPENGKALIYVLNEGNRLRGTDIFDVYIDSEYMGDVWPATYLYSMIDPGKYRIKASTQVRKEGRGWSRPDWYQNSWGAFEAKPGTTYFFEVENDGANTKLVSLSKTSGSKKILDLELDIGNEYDRLDRGFEPRAREPIDVCPFGSSVPQTYTAEEIQEWSLTCEFERDF